MSVFYVIALSFCYTSAKCTECHILFLLRGQIILFFICNSFMSAIYVIALSFCYTSSVMCNIWYLCEMHRCHILFLIILFSLIFFYVCNLCDCSIFLLHQRECTKYDICAKCTDVIFCSFQVGECSFYFHLFCLPILAALSHSAMVLSVIVTFPDHTLFFVGKDFASLVWHMYLSIIQLTDWPLTCHCGLSWKCRQLHLVKWTSD